MSLSQEIALVTGASRGIGQAIALALGAQGATVIGTATSDQGAAAIQTSFAGQGVKGMGLALDVTAAGSIEAGLKAIQDAFGAPTILVNNAGITQRSAFAVTKVAVYRQVMDVNFFGALHCTKVAMASLIERQGTIIVIESLAAVAPLLGRTGYCASKHALHGLFTSLRAELIGSGVHIMIVCPGFVKTNLQARALGANGRVTRHPQSTVGRQDSPARVADAVYRAMLKQKNAGPVAGWKAYLLAIPGGAGAL